MSVRFSVKADVKRLKRSLDDVQRKELPRAVPPAMNRALKRTQTETIRASSREIRVAQKVMRKRIRFQRRDRATRKVWTGGVFTVISDMPARDFGKMRQLKKGARAGRRTFDGAFIATMPSGHTGIFRRTGAKRPMTRGRYAESDVLRQPITEKRVVVRHTVERIAETNIRTVGVPEFSKRLLHEMTRRLNKKGLL